jgi:hypothetical protein
MVAGGAVVGGIFVAAGAAVSSAAEQAASSTTIMRKSKILLPMVFVGCKDGCCFIKSPFLCIASACRNNLAGKEKPL